MRIFSDRISVLYARLEKINHLKRQKRFYNLSLSQNLFNEWVVTREWGRIGAKGGKTMVEYYDCKIDAVFSFDRRKKVKEGRGYGVIPRQLTFDLATGLALGSSL